MSAYPPPSEFSSIFNESFYNTSNTGLTQASGDLRYLKLTGGTEIGLVTFNAGLNTTNVLLSGSLIFSNSGFTNTISTTTLTSNRSINIPNASGTLALTSDLSNYVNLTTSQSISGVKTFSTAPVISTITNTGTLTLPTTTCTLLGNNPTQTVQNKIIQVSSNSSIASFTATTITTSFAHNLGVGDVIQFPYVGSMTGIAIATNYTIATAPTTTTFTMTGITSMAGTVNNAYYIIITRAAANESTAGGEFLIADASNTSNGLYFDVSGSTIPTVIRFQSAANALVITFPSFGGTVAMLNNTQTFNGNKTFSGQIISSRAGNTTVASSSIYSNPASTALTGSTDYYWTTFAAPPTTGSTSGHVSTVYIAGAPSNTGSGGLSSSLRIDAGDVRCTNTASNIYCTNLRPASSNVLNMFPFTNASNGTCSVLISPSSASWSSGGSGVLLLGDTNHSITATNGSGMTILDTNGIRFDTTGTYFKSIQRGSSAYSTSLAASTYASVAITFPNTFASTPTQVLVSLNLQSGATYWDQCSCQAFNITTTGFSVGIRNNNTSNATTGTVNIVYTATL